MSKQEILTGARAVVQEHAGDGQAGSARNDATRYLCAGALTQPPQFREFVLKRACERHKASAPELNVDLHLVATVCRTMREEDTPYQIGFAAAGALLVYGLLQLLLPLPTGLDFLTDVFGWIPILGSLPPLLVLAWLVSAVLATVRACGYHNRIVRFFTRDNFSAQQVAKEFVPFGGEPPRTVEHPNPIVYSGFEPFVGAGVKIGGWSFVVDVAKAKTLMEARTAVTEFTENELFETVTEAVGRLDLPGLSVTERGFASGVGLRDMEQILPDVLGRPNQQMSVGFVRAAAKLPGNRMRRYLWVQIDDWFGELTVSHILRFSLRSKKLFVENTQHVLPPVRDAFRVIDQMQPLDFSQGLSHFVRNLYQGPVASLQGLAYLYDRIVAAVKDYFAEQKTRRQIVQNPLFDFGATAGVRESYADPRFTHYFQKLDQEMYIKILDQTILDALVEFLDAHNVDTATFNETRTMIFNSGVIMTGGEMKAKAMAVGREAQAKAQSGQGTMAKLMKAAKPRGGGG